MFAIVKIGSAQFKVAEGDTIVVNRLPTEEGKDLSLDQILLILNKEDVRIGQPYLKDVKIKAKVLKHFFADKVIAFKYRRRKHSSTKRAHRQKLTSLNITKIFV